MRSFTPCDQAAGLMAAPAAPCRRRTDCVVAVGVGLDRAVAALRRRFTCSCNNCSMDDREKTIRDTVADCPHQADEQCRCQCWRCSDLKALTDELDRQRRKYRQLESVAE